MKQCLERLYNGMIKENPTFVLMLGMCPTLAVTTSAINGLGMGLSTMVVLALSNFIISGMRKIIPDKVRIPAYIVIIATFVTLVELLLHAYVPVLHESLGIYISLIVVNCIILGRAESYASKNKMMPSLFDGIGMGLGFTLALTLIGLVREFIGAGTVFGFSGSDIYGTPLPELLIGLVNQWLDPESTSETVQFWNRVLTDEISSFGPVGIMIMAPGAFFILAVLTAIQNAFKIKGQRAGKDVSKIQSGCNSDCMTCKESDCNKRTIKAESAKLAKNETVKQVMVQSESADEVLEAKNKESVEKTPEEEKAEKTEESTVAVSEIKETVERTVELTETKEAEENAVEVPEIRETEERSIETVKEDTSKEKKRKKTLLEVTQEIDIVELEELLGENEEDEADE